MRVRRSALLCLGGAAIYTLLALVGVFFSLRVAGLSAQTEPGASLFAANLMGFIYLVLGAVGITWLICIAASDDGEHRP